MGPLGVCLLALLFSAQFRLAPATIWQWTGSGGSDWSRIEWPEDRREEEDYEIVPLPRDNPTLTHFNFTAFGRLLSLRLEPNNRLVSRSTFLVRERHVTRQLASPVDNCHYLHSDGVTTAAFSACRPHGLIHGWIFLEGETLEVRPLESHQSLRSPRRPPPPALPGLVPYVVKRAAFPGPLLFTDQLLLPEDVLMEIEESKIQDMEEIEQDSGEDPELAEDGYERSPSSAPERPVLEVAMFFDEAGHRAFAPYLGNDDRQVADMLLAYLNGVQALYHHPSSGQMLDIVLVRLELLKSQPADLPAHGGERGALLDSFCGYNAKHDPPGDADPAHWDMGLYVSGLDFYAIEGGRRSDITMGLSTVGGVCLEKYSCVIAELGTTNALGKPYPSAGFTSVYVLAHEIGHNLGMHHDSSSNSCPSEGFIMSPSRGTSGETIWSPCSAQVMRTLASEKKCLSDRPKSIAPERDHERKMHDHPGQLWGAKRQCEVLLRDRDAEVRDPSSAQGMCQSLECRTPHRSGYYFAGPALDGTVCAENKWCQGGECVKAEGAHATPEKVVKGGWSKWTVEDCASGCIAKSKGFHAKHRQCNNPVPVNTEEGCDGPSFDIELCKDEKVCKKKKRTNPADYARKKCAEFSKTLSFLDPKGSGLQAPHEEGRLWVACSIFCRRRDNGSYYAPRLDLDDVGLDPYFPDGTRCHDDGKHAYYCMNHHCRPEQFRGAKSLPGTDAWDELSSLVPQNAMPRPLALPDPLIRYLSLDGEGKPLLTVPPAGAAALPPDGDQWASRDYLDLPQPM